MAEPIGPRFAADHGLYDRRYPRQEQSADGLTDRPPLPSLPYLDTEKIKREQYLYSNSIPVTTSLNMNAPPPLISPTTTYSGPPPPYSYPASTVSSSLGGREGHTVPPPPPPPPPPPLNHSYAPPSESRPAYGDDKDRSMHHASRQSLPSIQEALKQDHGITINSLLSPTTTAAPPRTQYITQSPTSPSNTRTFGEVPPRRPPESYPTHDPTNSRPYDSYERTTTTRPTFSPRLSSLTNQSPLTSSKPNDSHPATSMSPSMHSRAKAPSSKPRQPPSPGYPFGNQRSSPPTSSYMPKPGPHPYPYTTSNPAVTAYPGSSIHQSTWRDLALEAKRAEEIRQATIRDSPPGPHRTYGESVKRQLDNFDIETSLNEIAEGSGHALNFAQTYGIHAHQTQRSGPVPGSLPSLSECDDMMRQQQRVLDSMASIRELIVRQQAALQEQRIYDQRTSFKSAPSEADEDPQSYMEKMDGVGGFAGAEAKKRRGRAAPPGRCHSCNRAETPEWRRGPDGARTLCNACGLHYAKLQRKMDSKDSGSGPSKLRPKESASSP